MTLAPEPPPRSHLTAASRDGLSDSCRCQCFLPELTPRLAPECCRVLLRPPCGGQDGLSEPDRARGTAKARKTGRRGPSCSESDVTSHCRFDARGMLPNGTLHQVGRLGKMLCTSLWSGRKLRCCRILKVLPAMQAYALGTVTPRDWEGRAPQSFRDQRLWEAGQGPLSLRSSIDPSQELSNLSEKG